MDPIHLYSGVYPIKGKGLRSYWVLELERLIGLSTTQESTPLYVTVHHCGPQPLGDSLKFGAAGHLRHGL